MSVCTVAGWSMELVKESATTPSARFFFVGITISGETLTGRAFDSSGNETPLSGTCRPFGGTTSPPDLSLMHFEFTARGGGGSDVRIFISGYGFTVPGSSPSQGVFRGKYVVFSASPALAGGTRVSLAVDPGDTGTGNGNQT